MNPFLTFLLLQGTHLYRRCVSENIKGEYGPYWGYAKDIPGEDYVSIEFPRVAPSARKSFSELLIETDTLDRGPLALYAAAPYLHYGWKSLNLLFSSHLYAVIHDCGLYCKKFTGSGFL